MKYRKTAAIIGPTGSGKTAVTFNFARLVGVGEAAIIDKTFLFRHFRISIGLFDSLAKQVERTMHLL